MAEQTDPPEPLLRYFRYAHLKDDELAEVSLRFHDLAHELVAILPRCPERTVALRKLLEAKDCAVRAALPDEPEAEEPAPASA